MRRRAHSNVVTAAAAPMNTDNVDNNSSSTTMEELFEACYQFVASQVIPLLDDEAKLRPYAECTPYPDTQRIGIYVDHVQEISQAIYQLLADQWGPAQGASRWSIKLHDHTGDPYLEIILSPVLRQVTQTREEKEAKLREAYFARKERKAGRVLFLSILSMVALVNAIFWFVFLPYVARPLSMRQHNTNNTAITSPLPDWMENWGVGIREFGWKWVGNSIINFLGSLQQTWMESYSNSDGAAATTTTTTTTTTSTK